MFIWLKCTTSRSRVDGEWPSLTLNFKSDTPEDNEMFMLRALFFAYEDRDRELETLNRLHVACNGEKKFESRRVGVREASFKPHTNTHSLQITYM